MCGEDSRKFKKASEGVRIKKVEQEDPGLTSQEHTTTTTTYRATLSENNLKTS